MFTIHEIQMLHAKVKDGADFPNYIDALKALGVVRYSIQVNDGYIDYYGLEGHHVRSRTKHFPALRVSDRADKEKLQHALTIHQQGQTNYITFCKHAASAGVKSWEVDITFSLCTYHDNEDKIILAEKILLPSENDAIL